MIHGNRFPRILNEAAEVDDFELWYYHLIHDNRCFFDNRPAQHWYNKLGFGPLVEGFHVNDHFNVNTKLEAFSMLGREAVVKLSVPGKVCHVYCPSFHMPKISRKKVAPLHKTWILYTLVL